MTFVSELCNDVSCSIQTKISANCECSCGNCRSWVILCCLLVALLSISWAKKLIFILKMVRVVVGVLSLAIKAVLAMGMVLVWFLLAPRLVRAVVAPPANRPAAGVIPTPVGRPITAPPARHDSVIWVQRAGEVNLETGPLLGQLTDEIFEKYGKKYGTNATIKEFAAAGPKTYALLIADKRTGEPIDTIVKCKGIRLTVKASEVVTADTLIDSVKNDDKYKVPQVTMKRDKKTGTIVTNEGDKRLQVTFSKRIWPKNVDEPSLPIGWQE